MRRFNLEVDDKTLKRLQKMPRGFRAQLVRRFLVSVCDAYEKHGEKVLGVLIAGEYDLVPRFEETSQRGTSSGRAAR